MRRSKIAWHLWLSWWFRFGLPVSGLVWLTLSAQWAALAQSVPRANIPAENPILNQVPQGSPLPYVQPAPRALPSIGLPEFRPLGAEGAMPDIRVPVHRVSIVGATAFPALALNSLVAGLPGRSVKLARIEAARRAILNLYRLHGFVLSAVSAEIDQAGDVRFIVTEGRIAAVKLSKDIGPAGAMVLRFLDHLTRERPVSEASLERWLLLAQRVPGVSVHAVLQPSPGNSGALILIAQVSLARVSALLTADNRGFSETGPAEGLLVLNLNSLTALGDRTQLSLFHTSGGTDNFGQVSEGFFLGASGLRIKLYGGSGQALPGGPLRQIGYHSFITVFGAEAAYPLILRRSQALTLSVHLDAIQNLINTGTPGIRASFDSLRVLRAGASDSVQDDIMGGDRTALTTARFELSKGLPGFGASRNNRPQGEAGRLGEITDFLKFDAELSRTQTLFAPWPNATVALQGTLGGQITPDVLPPAEKFYLGGSRINRGFYAGEVTGDDAAYADAELQLNTGISFSLMGRAINTGAQFYGFYDWGEAWQHLKADPNHRLQSGGIGARFGLTRFLEFDIEAVRRLTTQLLPVQDGIPPLPVEAVYWGVLGRF